MQFKKLRVKNMIFIALLVFLFVEVLIVFPNRLEKSAEQNNAQSTLPVDEDGSEKPVMPEQYMQGVHLVESQKGRRDWELFSESAEGNQGKGAWNLKKVRVLFYNLEKVDYTVTGDEGSIDAKTKDLNIRGHVITKSANGYSFETSSIAYNSGVREIESPGEVVMKGPRDENGAGLILRGTNMLVKVDETRMLIRDKVTAEKSLKDKKLQIVANGAEFSGKDSEARFLGKVSMNYDKMKIEGPEATFLYSKSNSLLSSVKVIGGVRVSDSDKFATSENLDLDLLANKFTFRGSPKVLQNDDELVGDEITFLDGGKRVKVDKVRARVDK